MNAVNNSTGISIGILGRSRTLGARRLTNTAPSFAPPTVGPGSGFASGSGSGSGSGSHDAEAHDGGMSEKARGKLPALFPSSSHPTSDKTGHVPNGGSGGVGNNDEDVKEEGGDEEGTSRGRPVIIRFTGYPEPRRVSGKENRNKNKNKIRSDERDSPLVGDNTEFTEDAPPEEASAESDLENENDPEPQDTGKDLPLWIDHNEPVLRVKQHIQHLRPALRDHSLRLIHAGRMLTDGVLLDSWLSALEERQARQTSRVGVGGDILGAALGGESDARMGAGGSGGGRKRTIQNEEDSIAQEKVYLHCVVGPKVENVKKDEEATTLTGLEEVSRG